MTLGSVGVGVGVATGQPRRAKPTHWIRPLIWTPIQVSQGTGRFGQLEAGELPNAMLTTRMSSATWTEPFPSQSHAQAAFPWSTVARTSSPEMSPVATTSFMSTAPCDCPTSIDAKRSRIAASF